MITKNLRTKVSIVICTYNRARSLAETLRSLAEVDVPAGIAAELIVVDNGSTDDTPEVAQSYPGMNMLMHLVWEPRKGQCHARNSGLAASNGEIIVFTDDDLSHPANWLAEMVKPIQSGDLDAVVGGVRCAPELERPWMETVHRAWLACTDHLDPVSPKELIGANMAFSRKVLARVPGFDTDLGPGASGYCDDTLFAAQLFEAGYRLGTAFDVVSQHHFQPERLTRKSFLDAALKMGRSMAYKDYHWDHRNLPALSLRLVRSRMRLSSWRRLHPSELVREEGITAQELELVFAVRYFEAFRALAGTPRRYERHGLEKRRDTGSSRSSAYAPAA